MQPLVIGIQAIRTVLEQVPEKSIALYTSHDVKRGGPLIELAQRRKIPIQQTPDVKLSKLAGTDSHQGFVLQIKERTYHSVESIEEGSEPMLLLMLDQIFDPQNFGALLRTAEAFGVQGVIWSKNRGAELTPSATKSAAGASELLTLFRVSNLAESVSRLQEKGFEVVATVAPSDGGKSLFETSFSPRTVLVLGSEGEGIQPLICKRADQLVTIPLQGKTASLNVSAAAAILLAFFRRPKERD